MITHLTSAATRSIRASALLVVAVTALSSACKASDTKGGSTVAVVASDSTGPAGSRQFTRADFAHLRWLVGDWRGKGLEGKPFFERYRWVDDSTMRQASFSDSTFSTQKDSALIGIRGGLVIDQGRGTPWIATSLDTNRVNFASEAAPANHFIWVRTARDSWMVHIFTTDRTGAETRVQYQLDRVKPK